MRAVDLFRQHRRQTEVIEDAPRQRRARVHDVNQRAGVSVDPRENLVDVGACVTSRRRSRERGQGYARRAAFGHYALRPRQIR